MAGRPARPRTHFQFTVANRRAIAMAEVAGRKEYKGEILVASKPIIGRTDALEAYDSAIKIRSPEKTIMTAEDRERVLERYLQLGREGTSSVVTVGIPGGIRNFDHEVFYASVDEVQAEAQQANGI